jgi:predicted ATPase
VQERTGSPPDAAEGSIALPLSERVRQVIAGRLDGLSERGRRLAAVAAVIGREFESGLLERAADLNASETADGLNELVRRRVLRETRAGFDFTHDRTREVA